MHIFSCENQLKESLAAKEQEVLIRDETIKSAAAENSELRVKLEEEQKQAASNEETIKNLKEVGLDTRYSNNLSAIKVICVLGVK